MAQKPYRKYRGGLPHPFIRPTRWEEDKHPAKISVSSEKGSRYEQEDRYLVDEWTSLSGPEITVLAVMDCYNGTNAVDTVSGNLAFYLELGLKETEGNIGEGLRAAIRYLSSATEHENSGTTLSLVVISAGEMVAHVAVIGDSPVFIQNQQGEIFLIPDHNALTDIAGRKAAESRGAIYDRNGYLRDPQTGTRLQMSRVLGDGDMPFVGREPDIYERRRSADAFVVVASDGIFDSSVKTKEDKLRQVRYIADMVKAGADAAALTTDALARGSGDNITAIVYRS